MTLKALRRRTGLTQDAVADRLDVLQCTVSYWETGRRTPTRKNRRHLSALYGCTEEELLAAIKSSAGREPE